MGERLTDEGRDTVRAICAAHRDHYLTLAESAMPKLRSHDQLAWFDRLETEHDNLRAAMDTSVEDPDPTHAFRFSVALWEFWQRRGYLADVDPLHPVLTQVDTLQNGSLHAAALTMLANLASARADLASAHSFAEQAVAASQNIDDPSTAADAALALAYVHWREGAYQEGAEDTDRALKFARRSNDGYRIAQSTLQQATFAELRGRHEEARFMYRQAIALFEDQGDRIGQAVALLDDALTDMAEGDLASASVALEQVLAFAREFRDPGLIGTALGCLAETRLMQGDVDGAHEKLTEAMPHLLRAGSEGHTCSFLTGFAYIATARQQYIRGATLHGAIDKIRGDRAVLEPFEARLRNDDEKQLRNSMGDAAFNEAYEHGHNLTREQTLALAFSDRES